MRFTLLIAFAGLWSVVAPDQIGTGAWRSVSDLAAGFERLLANQAKTASPAPAPVRAPVSVPAPVSEPPTPSGTPRTIDQLKYPLEGTAVPPNSKDAEIWKLLQEKQAKLRRVKQEMLELLDKRDELRAKKNGILGVKSQKNYQRMDSAQSAILRALDLNLAYSPPNL